MSDFLNRLVGRKLEASQTIEPRVPSLYEPQIKGSDPLWSPHAFGTDARATRDEVRLGRAPDLKEEAGHPTRLRPTEPSLDVSHSRSAPFTSEAQSEADSRFGTSSKTLPLVMPSVAEVMNERDVSELGLRPEMQRLQPTPISTAGEVNTPASSAPLRIELAGSIPANPKPPLTPLVAVTANRSGISEDSAKSGDERHRAKPNDQSVILEPALANLAIGSNHLHLRPSAQPGMLVAPNAGGVRRLEHPIVANMPASSSVSQTVEPSIYVSIGRVEVRAVFPPPPPRRTQAAPPKPSLSLDDYLKQRNRGRQ